MFLGKEILAGIYIALVSFCNMTAVVHGQPIVGALLFPAGLMVICGMEYKLFTGMVRQLPNGVLSLALIGNLIGVILVAMITSYDVEVVEAARLFCVKFVNELWWVVLCKGVLCGLCITAACEAYQRCSVVTFLMVMVFVYCGMSHCIANAYYLCISGMWAEGIINWIFVVIGNVIGGIAPTILKQA